MKKCAVMKVLAMLWISVGVVQAEESLSEMLNKKVALQAEIEAIEKEYEPQLKPLRDKLDELRKEMSEKSATQSKEVRKLQEEIAKSFQKFLPSGEQSYGNFDWSCGSASWISVTAKKSGQQKIWIQVFHRPEMTEEKQKEYGNEKCQGFPAKRFKDKWVWIQCGKMEMRMGLHDKSLESDETLDAIFGSFDLEGISKL